MGAWTPAFEMSRREFAIWALVGSQRSRAGTRDEFVARLSVRTDCGGRNRAPVNLKTGSEFPDGSAGCSLSDWSGRATNDHQTLPVWTLGSLENILPFIMRVGPGFFGESHPSLKSCGLLSFTSSCREHCRFDMCPVCNGDGHSFDRLPGD